MSESLSLIGFKVPKDLDELIEFWILERQARLKRRLLKRWVGELGLRIAILILNGDASDECIARFSERDPRIGELLEMLGVKFK